MPLKDKFFKSGESVISPAYVFWCKAIQSTSQQLEDPLTDSNIHSAVNLWVAGVSTGWDLAVVLDVVVRPAPPVHSF